MRPSRRMTECSGCGGTLRSTHSTAVNRIIINPSSTASPQSEISAVRIRTVPSGSTRPERYLLRAISSMAGRFSRNTSSLFLLSPWKWSSSASRLMAHRSRRETGGCSQRLFLPRTAAGERRHYLFQPFLSWRGLPCSGFFLLFRYESRQLQGYRAISVTRFGCIWRDCNTHLTIAACPPLARIAKDFQRAGGGRRRRASVTS